jgi:hypothetical protein
MVLAVTFHFISCVFLEAKYNHRAFTKGCSQLNSIASIPAQHVPNILVNALFSALVIVRLYTLLTLIHMREYMQ